MTDELNDLKSGEEQLEERQAEADEQEVLIEAMNEDDPNKNVRELLAADDKKQLEKKLEGIEDEKERDRLIKELDEKQLKGLSGVQRDVEDFSTYSKDDQEPDELPENPQGGDGTLEGTVLGHVPVVPPHPDSLEARGRDFRARGSGTASLETAGGDNSIERIRRVKAEQAEKEKEEKK